MAIVSRGGTNHDANALALQSIFAEWKRTDETGQERIDHVRGTTSGGLNDPYFLNSATVHDDAMADNLAGGIGMDWFWAKRTQDTLADRIAGEQVN